MRNQWYGDKNDLVKWSVLYNLAECFGIERILQIAYLTKSDFPQLNIDGAEHDIPFEVKDHFRNISNIESGFSKVKVTVFKDKFSNKKDQRQSYHEKVCALLAKYQKEKCIVFLDPDTGLEPPKSRPTEKHVLGPEVGKIWERMKSDDVLALYQHKAWKNGDTFFNEKRKQLAKAIKVNESEIRFANGPKISNDVRFLYLQMKNARP